MYTEEDIIVSLIGICFFLAWIGFGIWLSYCKRDASCGIKFLILILCTKGFLMFWVFYFPYTLIKNFKQGMKEGKTEQQKYLNNKDTDKETK